MKNRKPDKIDNSGSKIWYDEDGRYHNDNGFPAAIAANGIKWWYKHGKLHNYFGPAIVWFDGSKEWYINGKQLSEQQFKQYKIKKFINE